jgi:hypothetical protein
MASQWEPAKKSLLLHAGRASAFPSEKKTLLLLNDFSAV